MRRPTFCGVLPVFIPKRSFLKYLNLALALLIPLAPAQAAPTGEHRLGGYTLLHSVFGSTFVTPEVAQALNITRSANRVLITISLLDGAKKSQAASITGYAQNLIQQQKPLEFREIREQDSLYYVASLRTTDREVFHFFLQVTTPDGKQHNVKFTQELFVNP
jgi:Domain of unknown function (DUF4426)